MVLWIDENGKIHSTISHNSESFDFEVDVDSIIECLEKHGYKVSK